MPNDPNPPAATFGGFISSLTASSIASMSNIASVSSVSMSPASFLKISAWSCVVPALCALTRSASISASLVFSSIVVPNIGESSEQVQTTGSASLQWIESVRWSESLLSLAVEFVQGSLTEVTDTRAKTVHDRLLRLKREHGSNAHAALVFRDRWTDIGWRDVRCLVALVALALAPELIGGDSSGADDSSLTGEIHVPLQAR